MDESFERDGKKLFMGFSAYVQGLKMFLFSSHVIEALHPGNKLWQKSKIKCLILTFGQAC